MKLPKKGEYVSLEKVKELCIYFDLMDLWKRIEKDPPPKPFKSDGCSCWPDTWKAKNGLKVSLFEECLKHDLQYWAGYPGERLARFLADIGLMKGVALKTKRIGLPLVMFIGVMVGGDSYFGGRYYFRAKYHWGFGR